MYSKQHPEAWSIPLLLSSRLHQSKEKRIMNFSSAKMSPTILKYSRCKQTNLKILSSPLRRLWRSQRYLLHNPYCLFLGIARNLRFLTTLLRPVFLRQLPPPSHQSPCSHSLLHFKIQKSRRRQILQLSPLQQPRPDHFLHGHCLLMPLPCHRLLL